ncbi:MAG: DegQ family serine endoprotease [Pseudomonadota bacterium]|nr:DegQ family serine endoprotease [Pseudomonadota bacterium]
MKFPIRTTPFVLILIGVLSFVSAPAQARSAPDSFADLAERLLPAVVNISTTQVRKQSDKGGPQMPRFPEGSPFQDFFKEFFDRQHRGTPQRRATSLGSGFVISENGLVVTNNHVLSEADEITVTLHDDTRLKAKLIGRDPKTDLALLKVTPEFPLVAVPFGDSGRTRVGDWVVAIGNPFGLGGTVTAGIVSASQRDINSGPYDDFIQTDASINRGNSGGPMFNLKGEVIGINTAIFSPSGGSVGIGFAISANLARPIIEQLQKFGKARRGWLGVRIQKVTEELAQGLGLAKATGALVAALAKNGPAEKHKIKVGDVILKFDNKIVDEMRRLPRIVAETSIGKAVGVEVWRNGKSIRLPVTLGEFPEDDAKLAAAAKNPKQKLAAILKLDELGMTLSMLTPELRERFKLKRSTEGVVVTAVAPSGPAAQKRIPAGSIIRKIGPDHQIVTTTEQVRIKVEQAKKAKLKTILILIENSGVQRFVALNITKG